MTSTGGRLGNALAHEEIASLSRQQENPFRDASRLPGNRTEVPRLAPYIFPVNQGMMS
jgi:hypothetical protein